MKTNAHFLGYATPNSGTVWRLEDGRELFSLPEAKGRSGERSTDTGKAYFSQASSRLLTTTSSRNREAYLWDLKTGRQIAKLTTEDGTGGYGDQFEFRFVDGGKLVLIGAEQSGIGWLWNGTTGKLVRKIDGYAGVVSRQGQDKILKLADGKVLVTGLDGQEELRFGRGFNINQVSDLQIDFETNSALAGGRNHDGQLELGHQGWRIACRPWTTFIGRRGTGLCLQPRRVGNIDRK